MTHHLLTFCVTFALLTPLALSIDPPAKRAVLRHNYGVLFTHHTPIAPQSVTWRHLFVVPTEYTQLLPIPQAKCRRNHDPSDIVTCYTAETLANFTHTLLTQVNFKIQTINDLLPLITSSVRVKRGLFNKIGKAYKYLTGVATAADIVYMQSAVLKIEELTNLTRNEILTMSDDLQSLSELANDRFNLIDKQLTLTRDIFDEYVKDSEFDWQNLYQYIQRKLSAVSTNFYHVNLLFEIHLELIQQHFALQQLIQGYLPLHFVNKFMLQSVLAHVESQLSARFVGFRIQETDPLFYYKNPSTLVIRDAQYLYIQIVIPLIASTGLYQLYFASSYPMSLDNGATQIELPKPYIAISNDNKFFLELSLDEYTHCFDTPNQPHVCPYLTRIQETQFHTCLSALYFDIPTEVTSKCPLTYFNQNPPVTILPYDGSHYLVSASFHLKITWWFHCPGKNTVTFKPNATIFIVRVPCLCTLANSENFVSTPSLLNCSDDQDQNTLIFPHTHYLSLIYQYNTFRSFPGFSYNLTSPPPLNISRRLRLYDAQFNDVLSQETHVKLNYSAVLQSAKITLSPMQLPLPNLCIKLLRSL